MPLSEEMTEIVLRYSSQFLVDPNLVSAICLKESGWVTWRARYEPLWRYFLDPVGWANRLGITADTEKVFQATSWGCMQIMGSVARELGFDGHLTLLVSPDMGIAYGAKKLMDLQKKYAKLEDVISAYNAGTPAQSNGVYINQSYVDDVLRNIAMYKGNNGS